MTRYRCQVITCTAQDIYIYIIRSISAKSSNSIVTMLPSASVAHVHTISHWRDVEPGRNVLVLTIGANLRIETQSCWSLNSFLSCSLSMSITCMICGFCDRVQMSSYLHVLYMIYVISIQYLQVQFSLIQ